jgi:Lar family restriction alleviation protein
VETDGWVRLVIGDGNHTGRYGIGSQVVRGDSQMDAFLIAYEPCPFCGREDLGCVLVEPSDYKVHNYWTIECPGCSVSMTADTKEACVALWNKRATGLPVFNPDKVVDRHVKRALKPFIDLAPHVESRYDPIFATKDVSLTSKHFKTLLSLFVPSGDHRGKG